MWRIGDLLSVVDLIRERAREGSAVVLEWVKAHLVVEGNEVADKVPKSACRLPFRS